jgi:ABC-type multidrug transport system ATPase subunit
MTNIVQIKNLSISKHKMKILNNVNFNVPIGRVCAVLGPNGAGKTTTIKSIMGLIPNYNGEILINEINAKKVISRESVGYIPERDTLPNMTMKKFLYMCASFTKMNHDVIENKILY